MLIENEIVRLQNRVDKLEAQEKSYIGRIVNVERSNRELRELVARLLPQPVSNGENIGQMDWTLMPKSNKRD